LRAYEQEHHHNPSVAEGSDTGEDLPFPSPAAVSKEDLLRDMSIRLQISRKKTAIMPSVWETQRNYIADLRWDTRCFPQQQFPKA
jgi:hypothetical protein